VCVQQMMNQMCTGNLWGTQ